MLYYLSSIPTLLLGVRNWPAALAFFVGLRPDSSFVLELRDGCKLRVRTAMDVWIVKESCLDRQYERLGVEIQDGWTVLDVGAALGDFSISVARRCPGARVFAYEPFPQSFALLQENLALNRVENVRAFPQAIGAEAGSMLLAAVSSEAVQHSTVSESGSEHELLRVPSITLEQVFDRLRLARCDFLKVDCEGAEYGILFNTDPATLKKIRHLCLEYHDAVTPHSHLDLVEFLERNGFRTRLAPNPVHRHLGLLYAANLGNTAATG